MIWFFFFFDEEWKDVAGYNGYYQVSDCGNVRSVDKLIQCYNGKKYFRKGRILKFFTGGTSKYLEVQLSKNNQTKKYLVHRLVADAFLKCPHKNLEVNHIDGNIYNNSSSNLEYISHLENIRHAIKNGLTSQNGENSVRAKLTNVQANCIRCMHWKWKIKQNAIAQIYDVSKQTICDIVNNKSYRK